MLITGIVITICVLIEYTALLIFSEFATLTYNTGAAFGMFRERPEIAFILSAVSFLALLAVCIFMKLKLWTRIGISIMAGGALSNMLERMFLGHVVDWIPFIFVKDLMFNLADVEIAAGALIILWSFTQKD
ncbi:MAG: signal peptidase II [Synergistaceae bacterium]|nr:signal peptidase II [Synergistaceae bacterium]